MSTSPEGLHRQSQDTAAETTPNPIRNAVPTQTPPTQTPPTQTAPTQTAPTQTPPTHTPAGRSEADETAYRTTQDSVPARHDGPPHTQDTRQSDPAAYRDESSHRENDQPRPTVLDQQKERFGGIKWGSAFFGWLTATGTAVILTALLAAGGAAFGLSINSGNAGQAAGQATQAAQNPAAAQTAGITGAIVALVVLLIAYYCGGYVAGRMARFNGLKQGLAVWVWAVVIVILAAILAFAAGSRIDISALTAGLPQLPINGNALSTGAIIAAVAAVVAALVGALLGGLAGMRFHRKIDRVGLES